jgi:hypothetical protein
LFILIFVLVILGVVVGGVAAWLRQSKWRRAARKLDDENRQLLQELATIRNRFGTEAQAKAEPEPEPRPAPLTAIPPPAGMPPAPMRLAGSGSCSRPRGP